MSITIGVLALQGAFIEHIKLLKQAASVLSTRSPSEEDLPFKVIEVRNQSHLSQCDALIIPGGESTSIAIVAGRIGLLDPLRDFVKRDRHPTWGTCAGLILLAEAANSTMKGGQDLIGGLDVRVNRNHFGRQIESFQADLTLPFLDKSSDPASENRAGFPGIFIRAPVVEKVLPHVEGIQRHEQEKAGSVVAPSRRADNPVVKQRLEKEVRIMGTLPGRVNKLKEQLNNVDVGEEAGDIIAVQQGNVFGTSFHPELSNDSRIHVWWLSEVRKEVLIRRKNQI